jgi:uncharacterized protein
MSEGTMTKRWIRNAGIVTVLGLLALGLTTTWYIGARLAAPAQASVGDPPPDLPVEPISFHSTSGSLIRAWFVQGNPGAGAVVLMHGIRGDRRAMLNRARFLHTDGYSILLFDFQAHGESPGDHITFGALESFDALAAVDYLRARLPNERIAALGSSLGGAACLLGDTPLDVDALILEAVYPEVETAVANRIRMRLGAAGAWLTPLLTRQMKPRIGVGTEQLRPVDAIRNITCPVLIIAGTHDQHTTIVESRRLFSAAPDPKEIWEIQGAAHVDLHRYSGQSYENCVRNFLAKQLRQEE